MAEHFSKVITIEHHKAHHDAARYNLRGVANVTLLHGDSASVLPEILENCRNPLLFFLDAHCYANPLLGELAAIKQSALKPVIAIHDFMVPGHPDLGYEEYPDENIVYEWPWIETHVKAIYGADGYEKHYNGEATGAKRGCVFVSPRLISP